jgi:hypothetical protein
MREIDREERDIQLLASAITCDIRSIIAHLPKLSSNKEACMYLNLFDK